VRQRKTLLTEPIAGHAAGIPVENVWMPLDEAKVRGLAFLEYISPLIKASAEARGLPPYVVASVLRGIADGIDNIPIKEEPRKEES
jgi:hypothetical protein